MKHNRLLTWCWVLILGSWGVSQAAEQATTPEKLLPGAKVVRLEARPAAITLKTPFEYAQLLLTAQLDNGDRIDVTRLAKVDRPASLVSFSDHGLVRPLGNGQGELNCALEGQTVKIPVTVSGQKETYTVSFVRDVMPVMSKLGCNAGTCHGAAKGKNGFKLSLRGYDPLFDHQALTDDLDGRRFDRASPVHSLMLLKPSGGAPHTGGVLMHPGEPNYELLRAWIAEGVKLDLSSPRVARIEIFPKNPVLPLPGMKQQMAILATYTDGSVRDVTAEAFIESSNTEVATADKLGLITAERRGEATMLARFEGNYTATPLIVMGDRTGFVRKEAPEYNYIDQLVDAKLQQVKVQPGELCNDYEFIRRLYIDLTGLPPRPEDVRAFIADPRPSKVKRDELVDKLVGNPDYIEYWTNKWGDLLGVNRKFLGVEGAEALRGWIRKGVADNMPYDKFVYTILTASGSNIDNPPAAYYKIWRDPGLTMENTTQLFLAIRFNCNKCHDHPFERWTQDQYYQMGAFFAQVGFKEDPKSKGRKVGGTDVEGAHPLIEDIVDLNSGEIKHERTGAVTAPKFPYTIPDMPPAAGSRREQLAHWITSKENPYFARSYVNRVWKYLLGVGLIEPVDDIRAGNPPSNPQLLDRLTEDFISHNFDVRHMVRTICKSRTYQMAIQSNRWNQDDEINFSHALARRLPAEVLYDAIQRATGSVSHLPGLPAGARAVQLLDSSEDLGGNFFTLFGKPPRESVCECERSTGMMLGPVLNLVNGPIVADALKDPSNRIARLLAAEKDDRKVVEDLFLAILCRPPSEAEIQAGVKALHGGDGDYAALTAEHKQMTDAVAAYEKQLPAKQAAWEKTQQGVPAWSVLEAVKTSSNKGGATLTRQADGSLLATGPNITPEAYQVTTTTKVSGITAIRLEVLTDPSLPRQGPGRASNGNFVLNEFRVTAAPADNPSKEVPVKLTRALADYSQPGWAVEGAIDGNPESGWAVDPAEGQAHVAVFELKEPLSLPGGARLTFQLDQHFPGKEHNIGRFRLSVTTVKPPLSLNKLPEPVAKALNVPAEKRTAEQKVALAQYYRSIDPELARLNQNVADHPAPPADPRQVGAQDLVWALLNSPAFQFNH